MKIQKEITYLKKNHVTFFWIDVNLPDSWLCPLAAAATVYTYICTLLLTQNVGSIILAFFG